MPSIRSIKRNINQSQTGSRKLLLSAIPNILIQNEIEEMKKTQEWKESSKEKRKEMVKKLKVGEEFL